MFLPISVDKRSLAVPVGDKNDFSTIAESAQPLDNKLMSWLGIQGHDQVLQQFRTALATNRLASTFLFVGPEGIGKRRFALGLAQSLLCQQSPDKTLDPCGECGDCTQVRAGTHADLELLERPAGRAFIPLELLIGDKEHRMREGLCHRVSLKPQDGSRKIAIIDDADHLNLEGANCLLKMLEEPPPRSIIILIGTSEQRQLPTIRSRAQIVRFQRLADELVSQIVVDQGLAQSTDEANQLARLASGSVQRAIRWSDSDLRAFRNDFIQVLSQPNWDRLTLAKSLQAFVDEVGTDVPAKRLRLHHVVEIAIDFHSQVMYHLAGHAIDRDSVLEEAVRRAASHDATSDEGAANCIQRCVDAGRQIDANANLNTLIACWIDDLGRLSQGEPIPSR